MEGEIRQEINSLINVYGDICVYGVGYDFGLDPDHIKRTATSDRILPRWRDVIQRAWNTIETQLDLFGSGECGVDFAVTRTTLFLAAGLRVWFADYAPF